MLPSHLRPMGIGEILDGAFALYRRHFHTFFATALVAHAPLLVLWTLYLATAPAMDPVGAQALFGLANLPATVYANVMAWGALTRLSADAYLGNEVSRANGMRWGWSRFGSVWAVMVVSGLAAVLGLFLLVVPGVIAWIVFFAAVPVAVLEQKGYSEALGRSRALARGAWGSIFLTQLVLLIVGYLVPIGVLMIAGAALAVVAPTAVDGPVFEGVANVLSTLVACFTLPLSLAGTTLLYYDRRMRAEAFDLQVQADGAALA